MLGEPARYPNPVIFDPRRYIHAPGGKVQTNPCTFAFGFGRHICPGLNLADDIYHSHVRLFNNCQPCRYIMHMAETPKSDGAHTHTTRQVSSNQPASRNYLMNAVLSSAAGNRSLNHSRHVLVEEGRQVRQRRRQGVRRDVWSKNVLICWAHGQVADIASELGISKAPGSTF